MWFTTQEIWCTGASDPPLSRSASLTTFAEAVTAHLAQVEGIDVISSTSARQYKQADKRIPEMGAERVEEGDKALDRAIELKGGGHEFSSAITNSLIRRGRSEEAIAVAEGGRRLDPLSVGAQVAVGTAYRAAGQYDRAINELRQALEMSPALPRVHFQLGVTFVTMGRYADAIRELEIAARPAPSHNSRIEAYLGYAYAAAGRIDDARAVLKELEAHRREQYVSSFGIALSRCTGREGACTRGAAARPPGSRCRICTHCAVSEVQGNCVGTRVRGGHEAGRTRRVRCAALVLCALLVSPGSTLAQQDQGVIAGRVTDPSGGVVAGGHVTATAERGGAVHTSTNADGHYVLAPLVVGLYRVSIEVPGFKRAVSDVIQVHASARARLDVQLELGPVTDTISVRTPAPLLQTDTSSLAHTIGAAQIGQLPVNGRNFSQLATLAAGVLPAFGHVQRESGFNAHGQWAVQNNFILDGVDNNSHIMGLQDRKAQVLVPNIDAVQEFQVQTSNYTAEFGRGAGAVMNVSIKSGTDAIHGTAHEFLRNDAFDARDAFDYFDRSGDGKADPNALQQHQFGFTLGGPVRKSRTFYFGSLEITSIDTRENRLLTVPTAGEREGIFDPDVVIVRDPVTGVPFPGNTIPPERWDPVAARLVGLWPAANFAGSTRANHSSTPGHERLRAQYDVRLDHIFSPRDRMFVRASWMDFRGERNGSFPAPAVGGGNNDFARDDNTAYNLALSETHVFGSSVVHEVRLGVNSLRTNKRPLGRGYPNEDFGLHVDGSQAIEGLARLNFGGTLPYVPLGEFQFNPNDKTAGTVQVLENLSIATGAHTIKFGVDLRWIRSDSIGAQFARGIFNFNGRFTGSRFADFLLGMTSSRQFSTIQLGNLRERDYMFYAQDDWRIARRLTMNLGLRYELASPKFDTRDRMSALDLSAFPEVRVIRAGDSGRSWSDRALVPVDRNNWAPRLGLAYQPTPVWTARAAWGLFFGMPKGAGPAVHLLNNWPESREVTCRQPR